MNYKEIKSRKTVIGRLCEINDIQTYNQMNRNTEQDASIQWEMFNVPEAVELFVFGAVEPSGFNGKYSGSLERSCSSVP